MIGRASAVWLSILLLASLNGAVREIWLIPALGPTIGRAVSTVVLSAVVFLVTCWTIRWIAPAAPRDALLVGGLWLGLTLAFEFLVGHYLLGKPWSELTADYDLSRGRIWPLVLVTVLLAPTLAARHRRLW